MALRDAIQQGDNEKVQELLETHVSLSESLDIQLNKQGDTPLLLAARHGHFDILKYLLVGAGCDINQYNRLGHTVMDLWLSNELPDDNEILHQHFCPFNHCMETKAFQLTDETRFISYLYPSLHC